MRIASSQNPGDDMKSTSTSQRSASWCVSSHSSRDAARQRVLAGHVQQPGRQLPEGGARRVPVLVHDQDPVLGVQRQHRDRRRVQDDVADDLLAAGELHGVGDDVPDPAPESQRAGRDRVAARAVGDGQPAGTVSGRTTECPAARSSAARTRPLNNGCARVGRERSSGCAWVPT